MPTITIIDGVKIECFSGDHPPPHIHASYSGNEVLIEIISNKVYIGSLPRKKLAIAFDYVKNNKETLLAIFDGLNPPNHKK